MSRCVLPKATLAYAATKEEIEPPPALKVLHPRASWIKVALGVLFFWIPQVEHSTNLMSKTKTVP